MGLGARSPSPKASVRCDTRDRPSVQLHADPQTLPLEHLGVRAHVLPNSNALHSVDSQSGGGHQLRRLVGVILAGAPARARRASGQTSRVP